MAVKRLREGLESIAEGGKSRLRTVSGGYVLQVRTGELDTDVFESLLKEAERARTAGMPLAC